MILRDILKNYYDHKYITIFNIVFSALNPLYNDFKRNTK